MLTTNYVVDESATRLRYDSGLRAALAFRSMLQAAGRTGSLRILWVDPRTEAQGWDLLAGSADVRLSLTDAISAAVARRSRIGRIFGFDEDFRALGFELLPGA